MKRVGIIRGGERELGNLRPRKRNFHSSVATGGNLIAHLKENLGDKVDVVDILIDRDGVWHVNGLPIEPSDLMHRIDLGWNTSHSAYSAVLENLGVPHAGQSSFLRALEENGDLLREYLKSLKVPMPRHVILPLYQADFDGPREEYAGKKARKIFEKFSAPWIVKSFSEDSGMGIHVAKTFPQLVQAIEDGVNHEKSILVEEMITGKAGAAHTVEGFRGEDLYAFPLYSSIAFTEEEKRKIAAFARDLHRHLGAKHYLKSDFVLHPRGKIYLLGIDSTPDLREGSHLDQAALHVGAKLHHVVDHILERAYG